MHFIYMDVMIEGLPQDIKPYYHNKDGTFDDH
jgi:hypothetical protein